MELRKPKNLNIYLHQTEAAIFQATKHEKTIMACSYLNFSIQKINQISKHKQQKMVAFFEELLSENNFEAVLVNFCCYEYGANASEAVQISTRILRFPIVGGNIITIFFETLLPCQNRCSPMIPPLFKNEAPH